MKEIKKWELISSEDVSPSHYYPIVRNKVKLANGRIVDDYFMANLPDVAMVLPITKDGKIVLVKQYKHGVDEIMIELPAGYIQKGFNIEESAVNELREETGIQITTKDLLSLGIVTPQPSKSSSRVYLYFAKNLEFNSEQKLDENEDIEVLTLAISEVKEMVKDGRIWSSDSVALLMRASLMGLI